MNQPLEFTTHAIIIKKIWEKVDLRSRFLLDSRNPEPFH
jgi:hypothetical protein